uniref:Neuronal growth regulator 1 n=1 Tax=Cynoglossus semilaevis TaxID=244447 RepID=A0A3P8VGD5_CYNSE
MLLGCIDTYPFYCSISGTGLPGKRPHGNRIRAWGLCASSSAPILHHISSLDGVRAAAESTLPCTLVGSPSSTTNRGKLHGGPFLSGSSEEEAKCGNTSVVLLHIYTFLNSKPSRCRRALGSIRYFGKSDGRTRTCDGHNDCGAGCLCLRSVAHCDHPQPLLLPAVLFARRTDGGLLLGGERGEQAGRHGSPEVLPTGWHLQRSLAEQAQHPTSRGWSADPRVSIVSNIADKHEYSLQIQRVDVSDDGQYTCSIQSERNPRPKLLNLIVKVPPKIYDISSDITVNEGSNVSLICTASGKPEPAISWRHITPLAKKYDSGEHLNITGISRDQAGDYECSALNDIASPDTKIVKVTVNFAPTIHDVKNNEVGLGRTALLRCEVFAMPVPTFEWFKGEKRIIKGQGIDIKSLTSRSILTVTNTTEDRYGNYTCIATNKLGTANASLTLLPIIESTTTSAVSSPGQYMSPCCTEKLAKRSAASH